MKKASSALEAATFPSYDDATTKGKPKIAVPTLQQSFEKVNPHQTAEGKRYIDDKNKSGAKALKMSPPGLPLPEDSGSSLCRF